MTEVIKISCLSFDLLGGALHRLSFGQISPSSHACFKAAIFSIYRFDDGIQHSKAGWLDNTHGFVEGNRLIDKADKVGKGIGQFFGAQVGFVIGGVVFAKAAVGGTLK